MKYEWVEGGVTAPQGFSASGINCGIRRNHSKKDLALLVSDRLCSAAAVYTQNKVYGAPVTVTRRNIANGYAQAAICNSGNANTCNADGEEKAWRMCELTAAATGVSPSDVIVASTGVIGQSLPIEPIEKGMAELCGKLSPQGGEMAAEAILTTDLAVKQVCAEFDACGKKVRIGGMTKGSGMIHPNMATMLAFLTTDAQIAPDMLKKALVYAVADSFNMISVDGDTSTNDMACIMANGASGAKMEGAAFESFCETLRAVCITLAKKMAADGEGATKLIACSVTGAPTAEIARSIAKSVISSSLVKAAMFGSDANWGRVLCAIGYTPGDFDVDKIEVRLSSAAGGVLVCSGGTGVPFSEEEAKKILGEKEITIEAELFSGSGCAVAWGCDLTYDYVRINGDYRT